MRERIPIFAVIMVIIMGCGYSFGVRLPEQVRHLEVPVFGNMTLFRGIEFELTETLMEELKSRTPVELVSSGGDAVLTGAVVEYEKIPVFESLGEVIAGRIRVTVAFKLSAEPDDVICEGRVDETQNFDLRSGTLEEDARREAMRIIAREIVYRIEAW
jgi:hypothetical protein